MSEANLGVKKGYIVAGLLGLGTGIAGTWFFTKYLPEQQERVARRQGEIMAEEFAKRAGQQYTQPGSKDPIDLYSIQSSLNTLNARLDEIERRLHDYKGANV